MALKKFKELPSGVVGEYWKITKVFADREKLELSAVITLFKDQAASQAGKSSLGISHSFTKSITKTQAEDNLVQLAYAMIKEETNKPILPIDQKAIAKNDLKNAEDA